MSARIAEFDTWRAGYGGATVNVYLAGTTTLASIYTDEALTAGADNPQTLASLTLDEVIYGKFAVPVYIGEAYELDIVSLDQTGIIRIPITSLSGENAGAATVIPTGGGVAATLSDLTAREFYVEDTALLDVSAATNSATITTAMGRPAAAGGGYAHLPDDNAIPFNQITVPDAVILKGRGRSGTPTVLQSQVADKAITLGTGSGLENVVVDGVVNSASSIGIYSKAENETHLQDVLVKRLATGIKQLGGRNANWNELYIDSCGVGGDFRGDLDGSGGDLWTQNSWFGGKVSNCTTTGVLLSYEDKVVSHVSIHNVEFSDNTGTALSLNGARFVTLTDCNFSGNTTNIAIADDSDTSVTDNTILSFHMVGGSIVGGAVTFDGSCVDVVFERVNISDVDFTFTNLSGNIVFKDCIEDSDVTLSGQGTRLTRQYTELGDAPGSLVTTTDAVALKAWEITLLPGQKAWLEAKVIGVQRNGTDYGMYHIGRAAHRPGSTLAYKAQTGNFTLGQILVGQTSGALARIIGDTDAGLTGTLVLKEIVGVFLDNEPLEDTATGAATCDGVLTPQNAVLLGSTTSIEAAVETVAGYASDFAVSSGNVQVNVTGDTGDTIDWTVNVTSTTN
jgi:uncharacterized protein YjbI with pentapeptide repeats